MATDVPRTNEPGNPAGKVHEQVNAQSRASSLKDTCGPVDDHAKVGVSRVEAFNKVLYQSGKSGKTLLWLIGLSLYLTMFAYALDQGLTTNLFNVMASSTFGQHSSLAAISTAGQIIRAISEPFIGKLADITSRPTTYVVILLFYVIGFVIAATSSTFAAYTVGICFTSVGKSGLDLLSDIIVGDLTPLEWRGFFGSIISTPFIVTVPINGFIAEAFVDNWRWGLGMFAILVPVLLIPAIITLYTMQRRGERLGMVAVAASNRVRAGTTEDITEHKKGIAFYIFIIKDWTTYQWTIFLGITTMGLSIVGPIVGLIQRKTHLYKSMMLFGAAARILAFGLLGNGDGTMIQGTARLVAAQLLFCLGSFNVVGARVGSQASVPHEDMASIIALLTLWSTLGSSIGSAVSSAIWTDEMLDRMYFEMPNTNRTTVRTIYGSISKLRSTYDYDDPIRQGSIRAYSYVNGHIAITAVCMAVVPFIATFFMPDFYLGKQQNAVTNTGLDGESVDVPRRQADETVGNRPSASIIERLRAFYRRDLV